MHSGARDGGPGTIDREAASMDIESVLADLCRRVQQLEADEDFVVVASGERVEQAGNDVGSDVDMVSSQLIQHLDSCRLV